MLPMSVCNFDKRIIHISIPKTAGTSRESVSWLSGGHAKHGDIGYYKNLSKYTHKDDLDIDKFFKFTFVRDPYTRFMSGLLGHVFKGMFIDGMTKKEAKKEATRFIETEGQDFNKFTGVLREQHTYLTIDGNLCMDFIGRFENLGNDWANLCKLVGEPVVKLPHKIKGRFSDYDYFYTSETRKIVGDYFSKDFALFNYAQ